MSAFGWAVIENGKIAVNTISDTKRAVMVNWLVTEADVLVRASWTDEHIETLWWKLHGDAQVEQVTIAAVSSGQRADGKILTPGIDEYVEDNGQ